ncbi:glutaredoxin 3 [Micavibrio aeruginosavorus]|uniref:Glutaredoxin n=1 Tax=Micavibrio aeruginosavorus (strain ARL-13) TaxID=856793 RepID=G2KQP1_MICAA|nr:glutaredoxin 3 [Micavibrio aeruginosavorus]AEP09969.1 glutaredoxin 3 [Micavibrio aeruginosavorus ARL-13]
MAKVEIYSGAYCPYCDRAKALLTRKGVPFTEYKVDEDDAKREEMLGRANGRRTIPQIFINDAHIGGCDDLHALDSKGELDQLLSA